MNPRREPACLKEPQPALRWTRYGFHLRSAFRRHTEQRVVSAAHVLSVLELFTIGGFECRTPRTCDLHRILARRRCLPGLPMAGTVRWRRNAEVGSSSRPREQIGAASAPHQVSSARRKHSSAVVRNWEAHSNIRFFAPRRWCLPVRRAGAVDQMMVLRYEVSGDYRGCQWQL